MNPNTWYFNSVKNEVTLGWSMRRAGQRFVEDRVDCNATTLIDSARSRAALSYSKLANLVGVSKTTLLWYKGSKALMPMSVYEKLIGLGGKGFIYGTRDAFWGQRIGGRKSSTKRPKLTSEQAKLMAKRSVQSRITRISQRAEFLAEQLVRSKTALSAEFVARMLGDGSVRLDPTYNASEYSNHVRMRMLVKSLFDFTPKIREMGSYYRITLRRISGHFLKALRVPFGPKSVTNPSFPEFITSASNSETKVSALRGLFDDEGHVSKGSVEVGLAVRIGDGKLARRFKQIFGDRRSVGARIVSTSFPEIKPIPSKLLTDASKILYELGIHNGLRCTHYCINQGSVSAAWKILISNKKDLKKVLRLGLITEPAKKNKLMKMFRD